MGPCTSKKNPPPQTFIGLEQKDKTDTVEGPQPIEISKLIDNVDEYGTYLMSALFLEQLKVDSKFIDHHKHEFTSQERVKISLRVGAAIQDLENQIYAIKSNTPTDILGSYINLALSSMNDIYQEKLLNEKSKEIAYQCLEISAITFHVLNHYLNNHIESKPWFDETLISKELKLQNIQLQGKIKIELVSTYGKVVKTETVGSNNPMMALSFNQKHAFGLVKQQTLKASRQVESDIINENVEEQWIQPPNKVEEVDEVKDAHDFKQLYEAVNTNLTLRMNSLNEKSTKFQIKLQK